MKLHGPPNYERLLQWKRNTTKECHVCISQIYVHLSLPHVIHVSFDNKLSKTFVHFSYTGQMASGLALGTLWSYSEPLNSLALISTRQSRRIPAWIVIWEAAFLSLNQTFKNPNFPQILSNVYIVSICLVYLIVTSVICTITGPF